MFSDALKLVLSNEGGYNNDPDDSGGSTNFGITQETYTNYLKKMGMVVASVKDISPASVHNIYETEYWDMADCESIEERNPELAILHMDHAVNAGVHGAAIRLQLALGVKADGVIGPITLNAIKDTEIILYKYSIERMKHYNAVSRLRKNIKFLQIWISRVSDGLDYVRTLRNTRPQSIGGRR